MLTDSSMNCAWLWNSFSACSRNCQASASGNFQRLPLPIARPGQPFAPRLQSRGPDDRLAWLLR